MMGLLPIGLVSGFLAGGRSCIGSDLCPELQSAGKTCEGRECNQEPPFLFALSGS